MFIDHLRRIWADVDYPFLQEQNGNNLSFKEIDDVIVHDIDQVGKGDVVSLIGDFNAESIATLLHLLSRGAIVVPLTNETSSQHDYFIKESFSQFILERKKDDRQQ